jgi:tetrapyrrole methylase family protein/MazG family protein
MNDFNKLIDIVATLRGPNGCPWDKKQTLYSLRGDFIEEAWEVVAALDDKDSVNLCEELGDVLLHVVMHAEIASEDGLFNIDDVTEGIVTKLIRRHPHVFGDENIQDPNAVLDRWEQIKADEKQEKVKKHYLYKAAKPLPAMMQAEKLQNAVKKVGFDWESPSPVLEKLDEELAELKEAYASGDKDSMMDELGDLLFVAVNLASHMGFSAEDALKRANAKFVRRFNYIEDALEAEGESLENADLERMEAKWQEAKKTEKR